MSEAAVNPAWKKEPGYQRGHRLSMLRELLGGNQEALEALEALEWAQERYLEYYVRAVFGHE